MSEESKFLVELEARASEQKRLAETELMPDWAKGLGAWLTQNPWRVIVPLSTMVYGLWRMVYGVGGREFVLGLFGGFR